MLVAATLLVWPEIAAADIGRRAGPIRATVTASSRLRNAHWAIDGRDRTAWCPARDDSVGSLSLTFDAPVRLERVEIRAELADPAVQPGRMSISVGGGPFVSGNAGSGVDLDGSPVTAMTLTASDGTRCIPTVLFFVGDEPVDVITGVDSRAIAALPFFVIELAHAVHHRDRRALAHLVAFPMVLETWMGDPHDGTMWITRRRLASPRALTRFMASQGWPEFYDFGGLLHELSTDLAPAVGSVSSPAHNEVEFYGARGGNENWHVRWTGRRWRVRRVRG